MTVYFIESQGALREFSEREAPEILAIDTEYDSGTRFLPRLALVQIAYGDEVAVIDPLQVDLTPLNAWAGGAWIAHDGSHDWWLLSEAGLVAPQRPLDSQLAARLLGESRLGLGGLCEEHLGVEVDKSQQRSDWLRRPLSEKQVTYAAADAVHLLHLEALLRERLIAAGRFDAYLEESQYAYDRAQRLGDRPPPSIVKIKGLRGAGDAIYGRAVAVLAWRQAEARRLDKTPRRVLGDAQVLALAQGKTPARPPDLAAALEAAEPAAWPGSKRPSSEQKSRTKLLKSWRTETAEQEVIDPSMILPPDALRRMVAGGTAKDDPMMQGWRSVYCARIDALGAS
jgi:ribonuclease D